MASMQNIGNTEILGTKYLKFWTYFSLPVGGIMGLLAGFGMEIQDMFSVLILLYQDTCSIINFFVAYGLHYRKLWAWKWNWIIVVMTPINIAMFTPLPLFPSKNDSEAYLIAIFLGRAASAIILFWLEYVYWKKRRILFA